MTALEKFAAANPVATGTETAYVSLVALRSAKPAIVDGDEKDRICATIKLANGAATDIYFFRDSVRGLPNFIPPTGLPAQITVREVLADDGSGKVFMNGIAMGVGA